MAELSILGEGAPTSRKHSWISAVRVKRARQSTWSTDSSHPDLLPSGVRSSGQLSGTAEELRHPLRRRPRSASVPEACGPSSWAFLGAHCLRDTIPVTAGHSQLTRQPFFAPESSIPRCLRGGPLAIYLSQACPCQVLAVP
ncbi:uncharacterized protein GJ701_005549 [Geothlypis trichas]